MHYSLSKGKTKKAFVVFGRMKFKGLGRGVVVGLGCYSLLVNY